MRALRAAGLAFGLLLSCAAHAAQAGTWQRQDIDVRPAEQAAVVIQPEPVRELPAAMFGYNLQHLNFQSQLVTDGIVAPSVVDALKALPGGLCRYPGGLLSNWFSWEDAVGSDRDLQAVGEPAAPRIVTFGPVEFLNLADVVDCEPSYTLNLSGWHASQPAHELPAEQMAASNAELARLIGGRVNLYQLGNELDRSEFQWAHEKYVARSRATIDAIKAVDPDARFIAFLRDFNWTYKPPLPAGSSRFKDFIRDVLVGLPEVNDFSLQAYVDDLGMEAEPTKNLPRRLAMFQDAMQAASEHRGGQALGVWITEYARGVNLTLPKPMERRALTSNLAAAVTTGDYLIGLAQLPDVQGAALWGANAGPWQIFDATIEHRDLRPRPVYWALRVLRSMPLPTVLRSTTSSPNVSGYPGKYDVRAVGFGADAVAQPGGPSLGLWAVNRARAVTPITISYAPLAGQAVDIAHSAIAGEGDPDAPATEVVVELAPELERGQFTAEGTLELALPASSVSSIVFAKVSEPEEPEDFRCLLEAAAIGGQLHVYVDDELVSDHATYRKARQAAETAERTDKRRNVTIRTDDERLDCVD